jgi:hypothetical protein
MVIAKGIAQGIVASITAAVFGGVLLVIGIDPKEIVASFVVNPPVWLTHPLSRIVAALLGGALMYAAFRLWPTKARLRQFQIEESAHPPSDSWRNVDELELWQVAHLWVGREPQAEILAGDPAYPILRMLKTDVTNYRLLSVEDSGPGIHIHAAGDRKDGVTMNTVVRRNTLLDYIEKKEKKPDWDFGPTANTPYLIPLVDLMLEAEKLGWRFTDDGSQHVFEFVRRLRDAGSTNAIQFWGRDKQRIESMTKNRALSDIDSKYWRKFKVDGVSCLEVSLSSGETQRITNCNIKTTTVADGNLTQHGLYADIHLNRAQAADWLKSQTIVPARICMAEAVIDAYHQTPQSFVGTLARESGNIAKCYAHEITRNGDVRLYGRMPPSREIVEIPVDDVQRFMFSDDASELHDQFHEQIKYVDVEISMADLARKIEDINNWRDRR